MATNERFTDKATRENKDRTEWHRIVVWGPQAEFCEKYLDKGRQVLIEGKLRTRSWQDRDGAKRTTTEIEAQTITLIGSRGESAPEGTRSGYVPDAEAPSDFPGEDESTGAPGEGGDDEVPPF
jgi:single-strand DNA-binding protein